MPQHSQDESKLHADDAATHQSHSAAPGRRRIEQLIGGEHPARDALEGRRHPRHGTRGDDVVARRHRLPRHFHALRVDEAGMALVARHAQTLEVIDVVFAHAVDDVFLVLPGHREIRPQRRLQAARQPVKAAVITRSNKYYRCGYDENGGSLDWKLRPGHLGRDDYLMGASKWGGMNDITNCSPLYYYRRRGIQYREKREKNRWGRCLGYIFYSSGLYKWNRGKNS